ncbi:peroxiredoxin Q/BCP [Haloferula luteola]|uniref:thioredoxin-dependent peroxiredoxin n=1 Tax=Haloferula luteola TaxID=595692 RepID=A0A840V3S1_9BACT|nr:peroxiredoxin Q/BCP [Haloferula luteola]
MKPALGQPAPDYSGLLVFPDGSTRSVGPDDFRGRWVALVFYPKDATPGCTTQACELRDGWALLKGRLEVIGVSIDAESSHRKFIEKQSLPYPLLVDDSKRIVEAYGVWVEKSMYGKTYMGTERSTFLISPTGEIQAILEKVKPKEHFERLIKALEQAGG